jgi:hypothetical protein
MGAHRAAQHDQHDQHDGAGSARPGTDLMERGRDWARLLSVEVQ